MTTEDRDRDSDNAYDIEQNRRDIEQNRSEAEQNQTDTEDSIEELAQGGRERWTHIHASEEKINELELVKIRRVQYKINILALFMFIALLGIAGLLQIQATNAHNMAERACIESQERTRTLNENVAAQKNPLLKPFIVPSCKE